MDKETKSKTTTPQFVYGLEGILDELVEKEGYMAQIGNTSIIYDGIVEDTFNGKREIFIITRKVK